MRADRREAECKGRKGEVRAAWYLRLRGWRIVDRRVKTPRGEVDLVARRGRTVIFVEVKWRARDEDLSLAIDRRRLERVEAAAHVLAPRFARPGDTARIDVLLLAPGHRPRHIVNATLA